MGRKRAQLDVTIKLLLESGELEAGREVLQVASREETRFGDLHSDGNIHFEGVTHRSLSSFAVAAIRSCGAISRKTANGWQAVSYRGKALDQYRTEFLEKRNSPVSESRTSREIDLATKKKRRVLEEMETFKQPSESWKENSSDSGCSRCSFSEVSPTILTKFGPISMPPALVPAPPTLTFAPPPTPTARDIPLYGRRRIRPSRTWFDTVSSVSASINKHTVLAATAIDGACGMKVISTSSGDIKEMDGEDGDQDLVVNMWLKKALNKRHQEECGMFDGMDDS